MLFRSDGDEERGGKGAASATAGAAGRLDGPAAQEASRSAPQGDSDVAAKRQRSPSRADPAQAGVILKPRGRVREEGEAFASQARVLPRPGRPGVENVELSSEYAPRMEEVLSREHYPAHYKEFIRRYFLSLSRGAPVPQQQPPGAAGAP